MRTQQRTVATLLVCMVLLSSVGTMGPALAATSTGVDPGPVWNNSTDWDNAVSATGVVHQTYGDRSAGEVRVGASPTGTDLVSYWSTDTTGGVDEAGTVNLTTVGTSSTSGVYGTSGYYFNWSKEGRANASSNAVYNFKNTSFTLSTWVKTTNTTGNQILFNKRDVADTWAGYSFLIKEENSDGVVFQVHDGTTNLETVWHTDAYGDGKWHQLTGMYNASSDTVSIYMDGVKKNSTSTAVGDYNSPEKLAIGHRYGPSNWGGHPRDMFFDGSLDEPRVYNRTLSSSELTDLARTKGTLTTKSKTRTEIHPAVLAVNNVTSTLNGGTVNITVESDPDGDGTFEETASPITVDGSGTYALSGLSSRSSAFRMQIALNGSAADTVPVFSGASLDVVPQSALYVNATQRVKNGRAIDYYGSLSSDRNIASDFALDTTNAANLTVESFDPTATTVTNFTVDMASGTMNVSIGNLSAGEDYTVYQDGSQWKNVTANSTGYITFSKDSNWSPHSFSVQAAGGTSSTSDGIMLSGACSFVSLPLLGCLGITEMVLVALGFIFVVLAGYQVYRRRR